MGFFIGTKSQHLKADSCLTGTFERIYLIFLLVAVLTTKSETKWPRFAAVVPNDMHPFWWSFRLDSNVFSFRLYCIFQGALPRKLKDGVWFLLIITTVVHYFRENNLLPDFFYFVGITLFTNDTLLTTGTSSSGLSTGSLQHIHQIWLSIYIYIV